MQYIPQRGKSGFRSTIIRRIIGTKSADQTYHMPMRYEPIRCLVAAALLAAFAAGAARADDSGFPHKPILGDFSAEIRKPDGHIDIQANLAALNQISANTYFYLIWHSPSDWDDLPAFASAAEKQGINIWVYIIPWSETPTVKKISWGFSEPYRTDYIRWAQEIARVSLDHKNIVGYVIDDFYGNSTQSDRFSVSYVRSMVNAGRQINPKIKFYSLVYFQQPWNDFIDRFAGLVDGVVAAYPKSRAEIANALSYLNDQPRGISAIVNFPRATTSSVGDQGMIWADLKVIDPENAAISFYCDDSDTTGKRGFHNAFVRVDGQIVAQTDTADRVGDHPTVLKLKDLVRGQQSVRVEIGVIERHGVARYPVSVTFDDIRLTGFDTPSETSTDKLWTRKTTGAFQMDLYPSSSGNRRSALPMILMPAGEAEQHEKRYPESGTPHNIANKVEMSLNLVRERKVEGVVTYCLPKNADDPIFDAVREEYRRAANALRIAPQE
jgi:hypothetical protein